MKIFKTGSLSQDFKTGWVITLLIVFLFILTLAGYFRWMDSSAGCIKCHSDRKKMKEAGYPFFYMTQEQVESESNHPAVQCRDCHLGSGRADTPEKAHKGMLKMLILGEDGSLLPRKEFYPEPYLPTGENELRAMLPKEEWDGELYPMYEVRNILYHDRNLQTLGYDPEIAKKTCGKRSCHPDKVEQYSHTIMGANFRQRTMKSWLKPYGPHNCGPSFVDTPPDGIADGDVFSKENYEEIIKEINVPFSLRQAVDKQKFCNVCHAGCLDCHYLPDKKKGVHGFVKKPTSLNCSGGGRGSSICHPGALERRRGDTYLGGDFSEPPGLAPDVHVEHDITCADCHYQGSRGMGDQQRKATCEDCHIEIEDALAKSEHKDVTCSACHTGKVGGYQLTHWGPGTIATRANPFKKYSLYYGIFDPPIIMKDQFEKWIAVKPMPHTVGNIKEHVPPSEEILFRWPEGETSDSYYIIGTFDGLPGNNLHLAWFEIQRVSHSLGKSRQCESCHKEVQEATSTWRFFDNYGAEPFQGRYRVIADQKGLKVFDMENTTPIKLMEDGKLEDFAPWKFLEDIWFAPGNFSIKTGEEKYDKAMKDYKAIADLIKKIEEKTASLDKKTLQDFKVKKGIAFHHPAEVRPLLEEVLRKVQPY